MKKLLLHFISCKIAEVMNLFYILNSKLLVPKRLKLNPMIVMWRHLCSILFVVLC